MSKKIILFGATGYTGRNTAEAMVKRGLKPVLAGRNSDKLKQLSDRLGGRLETVIADVNDPAGVEKLAGSKDILVSTVGPFTKYGDAALKAAIKRGAHYIDSTGEPGFIRRVFEENARAAAAGIGLVTACGYDYVPGNCAAGIALKKAGKEAVRVDVGYFTIGRSMLDSSQGTAASMRYSILEPGMTWRNGALVPCYGAERVRTFLIDGRERPGILLPSTESFSLPRVFTGLKDVNVYLGWFGKKSYAFRRMAVMNKALMRVPGYGALLRKMVSLQPESKGEGPDSSLRAQTGSLIVAEAYDAGGHVLSRTELAGANGYDFTFEILAWAADMMARGKLKKTGALGPVEAFGLDELIKGCGEAGLVVKQ